MRVLVFEPDPSGHHFAYVAPLLNALADLGAEPVLATTRQAVTSDPYRIYLAPLKDRFALDAAIGPLPKGALAFSRARRIALMESLQRTAPRHLCIPYADGLAQVMGMTRLRGGRVLPRGLTASGLLMRGGFAYPLHGLPRAKARLSWWLAARAPLQPLFTTDAMVYETARRAGSAAARRLTLLPEMVEPASTLERAAARRTLGLPEEGRYAGAAGLITPGRGCALLIEAFAAARLADADRLMLVGLHDPPIRDLLAGRYAPLVAARRIISIDRFVEIQELRAAVRAMDVVCAPHVRHIGPSNLVCRAAAAERYVLGTRFGWVGWAIEKFRLGLACDTGSVPALARALERALEEAPSHAPGPATQRWVRFNTAENYAAGWVRPIRETMGLSPAPVLQTWDWVEHG